jgi:hypothetical protein
MAVNLLKNKWRTFFRRQQVKAILEGAATDLSRLLHTCLSGEPHNNNMLNIQVSLDPEPDSRGSE